MTTSAPSSTPLTTDDPDTIDNEHAMMALQTAIAKQVVTSSPNSDFLSTLRLIGGLDISFKFGDFNECCGCLVVIDYHTMREVYRDFVRTRMVLPYKSGFLGFREVPIYQQLVDRLTASHPELTPQVYLVDGFGTFHVRGAGSASHLGVVSNIPTIGVGKTLLHMDGVSEASIRQQFLEHTNTASNTTTMMSSSVTVCTCSLAHPVHHSTVTPDEMPPSAYVAASAPVTTVPIVGTSATIWGVALRKVARPIYVSVGHRVSLDDAVHIVSAMCRHRVPEPIRLADQLSRMYLDIERRMNEDRASLALQLEQLMSPPVVT